MTKRMIATSKILSFLALFTFAATGQQIISTVASPVAGGTYTAGSVLNITWAAVEAYKGTMLVIDLSLDNGKVWTQISPDGSSIANSLQKYSWTIPDSLPVYDPLLKALRMQSIATSSAKILIYEYDGATESVTVGPFTIAPRTTGTVECGGTAAALSIAAVSGFTVIAKTSTTAQYYVDNSWLAVNPITYQDKWAGAKAIFTGVTYKYDIKITTMQENDGASQYRLYVDGVVVGEYTNPDKSNSTHTYVWTNIDVPKGAELRMESRGQSNKKIVEADAPGGYAWSRGRWSKLEFTPKGPAEACKTSTVAPFPGAWRSGGIVSANRALVWYDLRGRAVKTSRSPSANRLRLVIDRTGRVLREVSY